LDRAELIAWIARYEEAWRTPGTDVLAELFTEDASYSTAPYENPHRGLESIGKMWDEERIGPDEGFEMTSEVVAVEGDTGVARVTVDYKKATDPDGRVHRQQKEYRDLWIVRLNDSGLCSHFEEWPFWPPDQKGAPAAGG
jgi:ketosteroid isomerase-like protein